MWLATAGGRLPEHVCDSCTGAQVPQRAQQLVGVPLAATEGDAIAKLRVQLGVAERRAGIATGGIAPLVELRVIGQGDLDGRVAEVERRRAEWRPRRVLDSDAPQQVLRLRAKDRLVGKAREPHATIEQAR